MDWIHLSLQKISLTCSWFVFPLCFIFNFIFFILIWKSTQQRVKISLSHFLHCHIIKNTIHSSFHKNQSEKQNSLSNFIQCVLVQWQLDNWVTTIARLFSAALPYSSFIPRLVFSMIHNHILCPKHKRAEDTHKQVG